jgi:hypothetical protein
MSAEENLKKDSSKIVRDSVDLKNKCICPDGSFGLFLTCEKK